MKIVNAVLSPTARIYGLDFASKFNALKLNGKDRLQRV